MSAATGSLLLIGLPGCGLQISRKAPPVAPAAIAVDAHVKPPADLLVCPTAPQGFPEDAATGATIPASVRFATIRLAQAYAAASTQLGRLIGWETGATCTAAAPAQPAKGG